MKNVFLRYLAIVFGMSLSLAALGCEVYVDKGDKFSFGSALIGAHISQLKSFQHKSNSCFEDKKAGNFDCEYTDSNGISYAVDGTTIFEIDIHDVKNYHGLLIAGITSEDGIVKVLQKLRKLPKNFPIWSVAFPEAGEIVIGTGTCIRATNGSEWSYNLLFDGQGNLKSISTQLNWN